MDPISTARYGLLAASQRFDASAAQVANMGADGQSATDVANSMVDMVDAKTAFKANIAVVRFAQDMWDSLLHLQSQDH